MALAVPGLLRLPPARRKAKSNRKPPVAAAQGVRLIGQRLRRKSVPVPDRNVPPLGANHYPPGRVVTNFGNLRFDDIGALALTKGWPGRLPCLCQQFYLGHDLGPKALKGVP